MEVSEKSKQIMDMKFKQKLTNKQIAYSLKISIKAVEKHITKFNKKQTGRVGVEKEGVGYGRGWGNPTSVSCANIIRLHGIQWDIIILKKNNTYKNLIGKKIDIDNNTIMFYENKVEVYSKKDFNGKDTNEAFNNCCVYFDKLFYRIEHEANILICKERSQNIKLVRCHYAETNNEFAKDKEISNKIKIFSVTDGKLWFLIDNSFNLHEAEFVHSKTAKQDTEKIIKVFNDYRDNDIPIPSEVYNSIKQISLMQEKTTEHILFITTLLSEGLNKKQETKETSKNERVEYIG